MHKLRDKHMEAIMSTLEVEFDGPILDITSSLYPAWFPRWAQRSTDNPTEKPE